MSRYPAPELSNLPEDIRAKVLEVQAKAGFVPNGVFGAGAPAGRVAGVFCVPRRADAQGRMLADQGRPRDDRDRHQRSQPVPVLRGGARRYFAYLREKPLVADQVAVNYRKADISPRQKAMLDFAMKVCLRSHEIEDADFDALKAHGFDDEDAWDIAAITAFFGLSNRMASFSSMMPNPEFYLMGRVPKVK